MVLKNCSPETLGGPDMLCDPKILAGSKMLGDPKALDDPEILAGPDPSKQTHHAPIAVCISSKWV